MSKPNFSRGAVSVAVKGKGGPNTSQRKVLDLASPLILVPEETSIIKQSSGYKFSLVFYTRLSASDPHSIGMNGPVQIQDSWFKDGSETVYRPNLFVEFTYPEKDQENFYWAYHYDEFEIPLDSFGKENPKTIVIYIKDLDPETSRGTETTVQQGGG